MDKTQPKKIFLLRNGTQRILTPVSSPYTKQKQKPNADEISTTNKELFNDPVIDHTSQQTSESNGEEGRGRWNPTQMASPSPNEEEKRCCDVISLTYTKERMQKYSQSMGFCHFTSVGLILCSWCETFKSIIFSVEI